jgi:hypothetical protein
MNNLSIPPPARLAATAFPGYSPIIAGGGWLAGVSSDSDDGPGLLAWGAEALASNSRLTRSTSLIGNFGSRSSPNILMCQTKKLEEEPMPSSLSGIADQGRLQTYCRAKCKKGPMCPPLPPMVLT